MEESNKPPTVTKKAEYCDSEHVMNSSSLSQKAALISSLRRFDVKSFDRPSRIVEGGSPYFQRHMPSSSVSWRKIYLRYLRDKVRYGTQLHSSAGLKPSLKPSLIFQWQ